MRKFRALAILTILALLLFPLGNAFASGPIVVQESPDGPRPAIPNVSGRLIVQLQSPALATWWRSTQAEAQGGAKLDVNAPAAQSYLAQIDAEQAAFKAAFTRAFPGAFVETVTDSTGLARELTYKVVFNGMTVRIPKARPADLRRLQKLPGVKAVFPDRRHEPLMYASNPLIGSPTLWADSRIGGQANAGKGVKIAVIDTGTYAPNPFFNPAGFSYPPGFPKGDVRYTTEKVIAARAYFRPWDPPVAGSDTPWPGPADSSHGTHTSGTAAGNANTVAQISANLAYTISGVAPAAQIMSYKVFYSTNSQYSGSAFTAELVKAIEDSVIDGADVSSNSWGGYPGSLPGVVPEVIAMEAAVDAGQIVVAAAGNEGPYFDSANHTPGGGSDKIITVAASTTDGTIAAGFVDVTAPEGVPITLTQRAFGTASFGPPLTATFGPYPYKPSSLVDTSGSTLACDETKLPPGSLSGVIALVERGVCTFSLKVYNVQQAGAIAAIIYNSVSGGEGLINMAPGDKADLVTIPSVFVQRSMGVGMVAWYNAHPGEAQVKIDLEPRQVGNIPDVIVNFSNRGPSFGRLLKPDIAAPGVNILSSGYGPGSGLAAHAGFGQVSGTSMATPHISGAAALLRQIYPTWTPKQIMSALMSTAKTNGILSQRLPSLPPATILEMGAGRVDLTKAADPGLTFDKPSVSFGSVRAAAQNLSSTITAHSLLGTASEWAVSIVADPGFTATTVSTLSVPAGGNASFDLNVEIASDTAPADYTGTIMLSHGPHNLHIPFWVRVEAPVAAAEVLLIDNDFSDLLGEPDYPDVTGYYTTTLTALGVTYDYWNADEHFNNPATIPNGETLRAYKTIIWYTGNHWQPNGTFVQATPPTPQDQNYLMAYLDAGGNLIATGQDFAATLGRDPDDVTLYNTYFSADFLQDSIYDPAGLGLLPPKPSAIGTPGGPFSGMILDLSDAGDGAANQLYVDEFVTGGSLDAVEPAANRPLFTAISPNAMRDGTIAQARSSEPSLERPSLNFLYRTVLLSFGLEAVNNNTGFATREDLLGGLLDWINDQPTVSLTASSAANPLDAVFFTATVSSAVRAGVPVQYRWDFGDGSEYAVGTTPYAVHIYGQPGTYHARVEVTNGMGHRAVSQAFDVVVQAQYVNPAEKTIAASQDTYINFWAGNNTYGSRQTLWSGHLDTLRGLLQFDTTSIRADYPVVTATLYIYRTERRGAPTTSTLYSHRVTKSWSASSATWNSPWDVAGAVPDNVDTTPDGSVAVAGTTAGWFSLDVTDMVKMWVANPNHNFGVLLRQVSADDLWDGWATSEYWDTTKKPYIVVNYLTP
jgi:subtilisin family serine protease